MAPPFRIGVMQLTMEPLEEMLESARVMDEAGMDTIWLAEAYPWWRKHGMEARSSTVVSALMARETKQLTIGWGIISPFTRHPVQVAMDARVVQEAAGPGRFLLGFGTSKIFLNNIRAQTSKTLGPMRDAVTIVRGVLGGRAFEYEGDTWSASVPALSAKMQSIFGEGVVRPYADWKDPLRRWLTNKGSTGVEWTKDDLDRLVDDPPLPFFVLFEAERATQGLTLGPIGSIIVAETIYGALRRDPHGFENAGPTLQKCIAACAAAHFPDRAPQAREAVASIAEIACMPALLEHLARAQLLPNLMPA